MSEKKTPSKKAEKPSEPVIPTFSDAQIKLAADTARARVAAEMSDTVWSNVSDTLCKLHLRYLMEALHKGVDE